MNYSALNKYFAIQRVPVTTNVLILHTYVPFLLLWKQTNFTPHFMTLFLNKTPLLMQLSQKSQLVTFGITFMIWNPNVKHKPSLLSGIDAKSF